MIADKAVEFVLKLLSWRYVTFAIVFIFPIFADLAPLLDIVKSNPAVLYSTIATNVQRGVLPGLPLIDPSVGFIFQSIGKRAAEEIVNGHLPWWNPYEGVGSPLAGEMNGGAFFPLTLFLLLPRGQIFSQLAIQIIAGFGTLLFLRRLGLSRLAATLGALLFEINGTMAWLASGWSYSQAFLPFLLYGIELVRAGERRLRQIGTIVVALGVTGSIVCGFIEIAYLNGLLALAWAGLRFGQALRSAKLRFSTRLVAAGVSGALIAAPVIIAFFDYLRVAYVGPHNGEAFAHAVLPSTGLLQKFLPYIYGPIFAYSPVSAIWGSTGGYAMFGASVIAFSTLAGRHQRAERLLFGSWIVLTLGATFGLAVIHTIVLLFPGVRFTAQYRYFDSSWEFAICVLVAFAVSDVQRNSGRTLRVPFAVALTTVLALCLWTASVALPIFRDLWLIEGYRRWFTSSIVFAIIVLAGVFGSLTTGTSRLQARRLAVVLLLEGVVCFTVPMLSAPTRATIDVSGVNFLRQSIGLNRFYTMGPVFPNYGSYFGLASINYNDIPMPEKWVSFVLKHLDPYIEPLLFLGTRPGPEVNVPSREDVLHTNIANFEAVGVKYVLTFPEDRRLFETRFTPAVGTGVQSPQQLLHSTMEVRLPALQPGSVSAVQLLQANYRNTSNGSLHVQLCIHSTCVRGQRSLAEASDNSYLSIPFNLPLRADGSEGILRIEQIGGTVPEVIWEWGNTSAAAQIVTVDGRLQPGVGLHLSFDYASQPTELPVIQSGNQAYALSSGGSMRVTINAVPRTGTIDGLGVFIGTNGHRANGSLRLRACSADQCASGRLPLELAADNDFAWFALDKKLRLTVGRPLSLEVVHQSGNIAAAIWLWPLAAQLAEQSSINGTSIAGRSPRIRFNYSDATPNVARLVYHDQAMNVYELNRWRPYFVAPGCTIDVRSRTSIVADCRHTARLERLELEMPGWTANVNGRNTPIAATNEIFQTIDLPAGRAIVTFSFTPVFMSYGYAACLLGALALTVQVATLGAGWRRRFTAESVPA